jgi:hypothetical protein
MSEPILQLQLDVADKLRSESLLQHLNVVSWRRKAWEKELDLATACLVPSPTGQTGAALVVGLPSIEVPSPNVPGPELDLVLPIFSLEDPANNPSTQQTAEENAQVALALLDQWQVEGLGSLYPDRQAVVDSDQWPNLIALELRLRLRLPRNPIPRLTIPTISETDGTVTLTTTDAGADIYYTTDESFPGSANTRATLYTAPFAVTPGTVVRFASFLANYISSDVGHATIS